VAAAEAMARIDPRVRVFAFPKGERHGEAHRHAALQHARGRMVCQIADDDIWFPSHLAEMALLLDEVEFGNLLNVWVTEGIGCWAEFVDLSDPSIQARLCNELWNFFGPTVTGYRLSTYRRLPIGWSPAPPGVWTDLAMWRKFLALPGINVGSRFALTSLHFATAARRDKTDDERRKEIVRYVSLAASERGRDALCQEVFRNEARHAPLRERGQLLRAPRIRVMTPRRRLKAMAIANASRLSQRLREAGRVIRGS
jgi:hypothetical protein